MPKKLFSVSTNLSLALVCLTASFTTLACLNETGRNSKGQLVNVGSRTHTNLRETLLNRESEEDRSRLTGIYIKNARQNPNIETLNDLAVTLIRMGRYESAIRHLKLIERKAPGKYETAANLGTAYELIGDNKQALQWIKLGIARNQDAHYGTEWLHSKILETKLAGKPMRDGSILKLDFGNQSMPSRPKNLPAGNDGKPVSAFNLGLALRYQLIERTEFVSAPEPIVASLLIDWANLEMVAGTVESADTLYDVALIYGYPDKKIVALRKAEIKRIMKLPEANSETDIDCELCIPPEA